MRKRRELKLASRMDSLRAIEEFSERISDEYFLNDSYFGNILTCLTEAVSNAIIHGNKSDEGKSVLVHLEERDEGLVFTVTDQGMGFNFSKYLESGLETEMGRGLLMIRSLADEVTISNGGTTIAMLFRIHGIDSFIAEKRAQMLREYQRASGKMVRKPLE